MSTDDTFLTLYKNLNTAQKQAVDTIEGPVMVIAGPGTGKTTILTLRIANILQKTDTNPEQILALTFTDSGVNSMRKKLSSIIGSAAYRVHIYTFHGFCNEIIRKYPDYFPRIIGSQSATEIDQISIIEDVIDSGMFDILRPYGDPRYYVRPLLSAIRNLKMDNISPSMFTKLLKEEEEILYGKEDLYHNKGAHKGKMKGLYIKQEKSLKKNQELQHAYRIYEEELTKRKLYDFEDMILEVVKVLEEDDQFLLMIQEEFQYILADEHQDANNSQNRLLELLSSFYDRPNLFIVGDEKQAIYRFQGASLENFLYFKEMYKEVTLITLTDSYRSTQKILDTSHSLMERGDSEKKERVRLKSQKTLQEQNITLHVFSKPIFEYMYVAESIEKLLKEGCPPHEIAVLYRDNSDVVGLTRYLSKTSIPFQIESDLGLLRDDDIRKLISILRAVHNPLDEGLYMSFLLVDCLRLVPRDVYALFGYAQKKRKNIFEIIRSREDLVLAGVEDPDSFVEIYRLFNSWVSLAHNRLVLDVLEIIVRESGFLSMLLNGGGSINRLSTLETFFTEAEKSSEGKEEYMLEDFIAYIDALQRYNIKLSKKGEIVREGVRLMTAHKSKGLEFDHVFIIGLWHGHWGGRRGVSQFKSMHSAISLDSKGDDTDERRLFYVALTRARESISLSYASMSEDGKTRLQSQFVEEIDPSLIDEISHFENEKGYISKLDTKYDPQQPYGPDIDDKEYLNRLFIEQGLSVTALNNYLKCPWQYFYRNLLRIPSPYNKTMIYGNAIHAVLREYFEKRKKGKSMSDEKILHRFKDVLMSYTLQKIDYDELVLKAESSLAGYIRQYKDIWHTNVLNEFAIDGVKVALDKDIEVTLKGKLDKVELYDDHVHVVDYKTGSPKTRSVIEGTTKTSTGDYKRQLIFYKILLDRFEDGRYLMRSGEIDFVEPDDKGRYKKEVFDIEEDEVKYLEGEIQRVASEILDLSFWQSRCDDKDCVYCALRGTTLS